MSSVEDITQFILTNDLLSTHYIALTCHLQNILIIFLFWHALNVDTAGEMYTAFTTLLVMKTCRYLSSLKIDVLKYFYKRKTMTWTTTHRIIKVMDNHKVSKERYMSCSILHWKGLLVESTARNFIWRDWSWTIIRRFDLKRCKPLNFASFLKINFLVCRALLY